MLLQLQPQHIYRTRRSDIFILSLLVFIFTGAEPFIMLQLLVSGRRTIQNIVDDTFDVLGAHFGALLRRFSTAFGHELVLVSSRWAHTLLRDIAFWRNILT